MDLETSFGVVLKALRTRAQLTQTELAGRAGLTSVYVSKLEHGKSSPTLTSIFSLSEALGVSAHELIREVEVRLQS